MIAPKQSFVLRFRPWCSSRGGPTLSRPSLRVTALRDYGSTTTSVGLRFEHTIRAFPHGQSLASLVKRDCPKHLTPVLLLTERDQIDEPWIETDDGKLVVVVTVHDYLAHSGRLGRQKHRSDCTQTYVAMDVVEDRVTELWKSVVLPADVREALRRAVLDLAERTQTEQTAEIGRQTARLAQLDSEREKLLKAHYAKAVPLDLLKREQARIGREMATAQASTKLSRWSPTATSSTCQHRRTFAGSSIRPSSSGSSSRTVKCRPDSWHRSSASCWS
jgi:hypothetical protein